MTPASPTCCQGRLPNLDWPCDVSAPISVLALTSIRLKTARLLDGKLLGSGHEILG